MTKKKVAQILERLDTQYGTEYRCYLNHENAWQLLIATILSAQCTDARVNLVTKDLFVKYPDIHAFATADIEEMENDIRSIGFFHNKARNIIACCRMLETEFNSEVPSALEDLVRLPGVGRKTANVILSVIFGKAAMAVDTHVFRVSNRIGLTNDSPNPLVTEKTLVKHIPEELVGKAHHWLILHGRYVCTARAPKCMECGISPWCKHYASAGKSADAKRTAKASKTTKQ